MSHILVGLQDALESALCAVFGVKPARVDPALLGNQSDPPSGADYDGFPPEPVSPIALQLVQDKPDIVVPKASSGFTASTLAVGTTPSRILGANPARRRAVIMNIGGSTFNGNEVIAIGDARVRFPDFLNLHGFMLSNGYSVFSGNGVRAPSFIEISHSAEIWCVVCATGPSPQCFVNVYEEWDEGGALVS